jgi:hypothetical protein
VTAPPLLLLLLLPLLLELLELELVLEPLELVLELLELVLDPLELLGVVSSLPPPQAATTRVMDSASADARTEARLRCRDKNECMC